ncbi:MAG: hypothetical protein ABI601_11555 [bacterium]
MSSSLNAPTSGTVRRALIAAAVALPLFAPVARAQTHTHSAPSASAGSTMHSGNEEALHMEMTPTRPATAADSARAAGVAVTLRKAIAKYRDTTAAVADGYRLFAPEIKEQKVYHFSSSWMGLQEAFRFDPAKPTSILYTKDADGRFELVGAMYLVPKKFTLEQLDARIPLSIARWHRHVNWCLPPRGHKERWLERKSGHAVFGPESPIATKAACDAVGGTFRDAIFGWMVHASVFAGNDARSIWGDAEHAGHDMQDGMKMDGT